VLLHRFTPQFAALAAALAVSAVMLTVDNIERQRVMQEQRLHVMERVSALRTKLESGINVAVAATRSLAVVYTLHPELSRDEFVRMSREIMAPNPVIRNIGLSHGTVIVYVYPMEGNEKAVGLDYRSLPAQWPAYRQMMESGAPLMAGPVPLVQGGTGVIMRIPVFHQAAQGREFIGSVSAPLMLDRMLDDAGVHQLEETLMIAIRGRDGKGSAGEIFYGDLAVFDMKPVLRPVSLPGGNWEIAAAPRYGWDAGSSALTVIRTLGGLLCLLAALLAYTLVRHLQRRAENEQHLTESKTQLKLRGVELANQNAVLDMIAHHTELPVIMENLVWMIEAQHPGMLCSIMLLDPDGKHLRHGAAPSLPDFYNQAVDGIAIGEGVGSCGTSAWRGERVVTENIQAHRYWESFRELLQRADLQSCWSQPIKGYDGRVLGTFAIYHRQPATPQPDEIALIESYAALAALAIERTRTTETLRLHDAALNFVANAMLITDREGHIVWANHAFSELTGYAISEVIGHSCNELLHSGHQDAQFYERMWQTILDGKAWHGELINKRKNSSLYYEEMTITPVRDGKHNITHFVALKQDITSRKAAEENLKNMAFYDPLTNLPNRRLLIDRLALTLAIGKRSGRHGALMFLDLDNFKPLNDAHGHDVGDLLLMEAARRITGCVREEDTVARFGGDEFVVLLKELDTDKTASASHASGVAEKIQKAMAEPYRLELLQPEEGSTEIEHQCTASIGITLFDSHETDREDILKRADIAMYQAKAAGRNTIRFYDSGKA
jgi:diguanylate cyclase (GGDEF)-like protein/PAS domain S-box-containing protein